MSIIDQLIVELKIDASNFEAGEKKSKQGMIAIQKSAVDTAKESKKASKGIAQSQNDISDNATKTARAMDKDGKDASGFFSKIRNEAIMMLGVFTAASGIKSFAQDTINAASSTGILASQIGVNITKLSAMEAAAQRAGAASGAMSSQLADDARKAAAVKAGESVTQVYGDKFLQFGGDHNKMGDADSQLAEYAAMFQRLKESGKERGGMNDKQAEAYASQQIVEAGLNRELIPLINKGTASLKSQIATQMERVAITSKDAKAAKEARESWFDFTQVLDQAGQRVVLSLIPSLKKLTSYLKGLNIPSGEKINATIEAWSKKLESFLYVVEEGVKKVGWFAEAIGGWGNVLKGLIAIKVLAWGAGIATVAASLLGFSTAATAAGAAAKLAMTSIVPLLAAGAAGTWIGDKINDSLSSSTKETLSNTVGKGMAHVGAFFGHEESKQAIDPNYKPPKAVNVPLKEGEVKGGISRKGSVASVIQGGESGKREYNAYNRGSRKIDRKGGTPAQNITGLTIGEIQRRQKLKHGNKQRLFAVGKYQIVTNTLKEAVSSMKLKKTDKFTPELQDKIFSEFLAGSRRKAMKDFITGKSNNKKKAVLSASKEWASIADPATGRSYYAGVGGNKAHISAKQMGDSFVSAKGIYMQNKKAGLSDKKAYHLALQGVIQKATSKPVAVKVVEKKEKPKATTASKDKPKSFKIKASKNPETGKLENKRVDVQPPIIPKSSLINKQTSNNSTQKNNININVKSTDPKQAAQEIKTTLNESLTSNFISGVL